MLLWYPSSDGEEEPFFEPIYREIFRKLPASMELTIVTHPSAAEALEGMLGEERPEGTNRVVRSPDRARFSVWAEDAFVVVQDLDTEGPVTYLLEPESFPRYADFQIAELVATATSLEVSQSPLVFQGGNVLTGDDFVLVGVDYLADSVARIESGGSVEGFPVDGVAEDKFFFVQSLFRESFDPARKVHFVTSTPQNRPQNRLIRERGELWLDDVEAGRGNRQPIFHIDMFIAFAGRNPETGAYRILVGDPGMADRLLGWEPVEHDLQSEYDEIAGQLAKLGYEAIRAPLPYVMVRERIPLNVDVSGRTVQLAGVRNWYHPTSLNSLVQIEGYQRDVWLPTYGHPPFEELAVIDDEHERIWRDLGFQVHRLGNFHLFAMRQGALHCIKKYLAR
jgi:hypothetical protein